MSHLLVMWMSHQMTSVTASSCSLLCTSPNLAITKTAITSLNIALMMWLSVSQLVLQFACSFGCLTFENCAEPADNFFFLFFKSSENHIFFCFLSFWVIMLDILNFAAKVYTNCEKIAPSNAWSNWAISPMFVLCWGVIFYAQCSRSRVYERWIQGTEDSPFCSSEGTACLWEVTFAFGLLQPSQAMFTALMPVFMHGHFIY